jgi:hypothetical protein
MALAVVYFLKFLINVEKLFISLTLAAFNCGIYMIFILREHLRISRMKIALFFFVIIGLCTLGIYFGRVDLGVILVSLGLLIFHVLCLIFKSISRRDSSTEGRQSSHFVPMLIDYVVLPIFTILAIKEQFNMLFEVI